MSPGHQVEEEVYMNTSSCGYVNHASMQRESHNSEHRSIAEEPDESYEVSHMTYFKLFKI